MPVSQSQARARATLNNNNIDSGCNKAELKRWISMIFLLLAQLVPALSGEKRERGGVLLVGGTFREWMEVQKKMSGKGIEGEERSCCPFPLPTIPWRLVLATLLSPPLLD